MQKIELSYALAGQRSAQALIRNPLMDLLQAVQTCGSIAGAARSLDLSYRHVWGELRRWETLLDQQLLIWEKGQKAVLSDFGLKLLWAERQAQARLAPQIEALRADLERTFAVAFDPHAHVMTLHASHDQALLALRDHGLASAQDKAHLDIRFTGSVDAIRDLNDGRCVLAGFHIPLQPRAGSLTEQVYKPLLQTGQHKLIGFAQRMLGLMVAPGNPLNIHRLQDLTLPDRRFVNRPQGSGTRVLLDEALAEAGLKTSALPGYARTEPSHTAVAQAVATGQADAGLGTALAAASRGLGFVPLMQEHYFLVCLKSALDTPAVQALLHTLQTEAWQEQLAALPGYSPWRSGDVLSLRRTLPWWTF